MQLCALSFAETYWDVEDIEPGMQGEWHTVVQGNEIRVFPLRVLGVSRNFAGPRNPVIICEALDAENVLSGPVAGMSGSPVYIDGKLVGAYAYGYTWAKEQAIIGVTPIDSMIEIIERFPPMPIGERYRRAFNNGTEGLPEPYRPNPTVEDMGELLDSGNLDKAALRLNDFAGSRTPLFVSGFSQEVIDAFGDEFHQVGVELVNAPTASSGDMSDWSDEDAKNFEPGMPIAGVLMDGDFSVTGVGTVTWNKGNEVLGFGHPFFGEGDVEIPMASANILTVVRSYQISFKLSEIGPVVGSIYQDRLTGIAGQIGRQAPTTEVEYHITNESGVETIYHSSVFEHPKLSPRLAAIGLLQTLQSSLDRDEEQTMYMDVEMHIQGREPISFSNVGVGSLGSMNLATQLLQVFSAVSDNPFQFPRIEKLICKVDLKKQQRYSFFDEVIVDSSVPRPGETLDLVINIRSFLGEPEQFKLQVPIPIGTKGETFTIQIADANRVNPENNLIIRADMDTLGDILRQVEQLKSRQNIYVQLIRQSTGFQVQGDTLYDVPPSVAHLFTTPKNAQYSSELTEVVLWETEIPLSGVFEGSYRLNVEIR